MQALPAAEQRTTEAIGSGTGVDDNAAVETVKAERQLANQVRLETLVGHGLCVVVGCVCCVRGNLLAYVCFSFEIIVFPHVRAPRVS